MKNLVRLAAGGAMVAGVTLALPGPLQAQSVEEFYKGKTVNMVVSAATGGGADDLTRLFADVFAKHIPGQPDQIVLNKPGAGGMVEASRMYVQGDKDGLEVSFLQRNNLMNALLTDKYEQFDPRKVNWIGSLKREAYVLLAYETSPVQKVEDAWDKEMVLGATAFTNENRTMATMMNEFLGTKFKIVPGYAGSGEIEKAVEGGELQGWFRSLDGSETPPAGEWIKQGKMKRLLVLSWKRHPDYPDVPALGEFVKDESLKPLIDFFLLPLDAGRPVAVPGNVPPERVAALRKAFMAATQDPEYVARLKRANIENSPMTGEDLEEAIAKMYATPVELVDKAKTILVQK